VLALVLDCGQEQERSSPEVESVSRARVEREPEARTAPGRAGPERQPGQPAPAGVCTSADTCYESGQASLRRGKAKEARGFFQKACLEGHGPACFRLGVMYRDGKGVRASDSEARQWFEQACRAGSNTGCDALGH
jgi:hypothetical protein